MLDRGHGCDRQREDDPGRRDGYPTRKAAAAPRVLDNPDDPLAEPMSPWSPGFPGAEMVLVAMAFVWGAILGSFVNVVIHRVPRGESVVSHGSRCPACGTAIRPRDNIPILGWLLLRGRCRDCGVAISAGYPTVEATCGAIAAIVAIAELAGTGSPMMATTRPGIDRLLSGDGRIALAWSVHTVIPIAMLAWNLTPASHNRDAGVGQGAPWLVAAVMAAVTAVPLIGPPGFLIDGSAPVGLSGWRAAFIASCLGTIAGRIAGRATGLPGDGGGLAAFGAAAGWQAVVVVTILTAALRLLAGCVLPKNHADRASCAVASAAAVGVFAAWSPIADAWGRFGAWLLPR